MTNEAPKSKRPRPLPEKQPLPAKGSATGELETSRQVKIDLLKIEITALENSIRKLDDLANSVKNWSILLWGGSFGVFLQYPRLTPYIGTTGVIPLLFLLSDMHWRRLQRSFVFRYTKITDFVNSERFDRAIAFGDFAGFPLLDPRAWFSRGKEFEAFTSFRTILNFRSVTVFYLIQAYFSLLASILLSITSL